MTSQESAKIKVIFFGVFSGLQIKRVSKREARQGDKYEDGDHGVLEEGRSDLVSVALQLWIFRVG